MCTHDSVSSEGQKKEIGQWYQTSKQLIVIPIDAAVVPMEIDPYIYLIMSRKNFSKEFDKFVSTGWTDAINKWVKVKT